MPKKFVLFLSVAQTILSFLHWLLYLMLLHFFPALRPVHTVLLAVVLLCSVSFLLFSTAVHFMGWRILDWGYMLSGSLLVLAGYGFWFLLAALALSSAWPAASTVFAAAALLGSLLMTVYGLINARIIRVRHINVALPNLPEFWRNKTAVAAADIHLGNILREGFARKVVRAINTQRPDIVFLPGDYYDGGRTEFQALADELKNLKAPLGAFYVSGNHELYAGYRDCENAIAKAGVKILEDELLLIKGLQIVGLAYRTETDELVRQRLAALNIDRNQPAILLKHVPNHLAPTEQAGISFQISGHSHHGQIWPGQWITKKVWKGYQYGDNLFGKLRVYTSSGVGTWGPPIRTFTRPEIVKITFLAAE